MIIYLFVKKLILFKNDCTNVVIVKQLQFFLKIHFSKIFILSFSRYLRSNAAASALARGYGEDIPDFLKNRPRKFIDHCFPRWEQIFQAVTLMRFQTATFL